MIHSRKAFTMIELIFVIVIIGILAAIAVPKLAATRDDAEVSALALSVANSANEIAAYAVAQGKTETDFTLMSNSIKSMINKGDAVQSNNVLNIKMHDTLDCLIMELNTSNGDSDLSIAYGNYGNDSICKGLQDTIDAARYPMALTGQRIIK